MINTAGLPLPPHIRSPIFPCQRPVADALGATRRRMRRGGAGFTVCRGHGHRLLRTFRTHSVPRIYCHGSSGTWSAVSGRKHPECRQWTGMQLFVLTHTSHAHMCGRYLDMTGMQDMTVTSLQQLVSRCLPHMQERPYHIYYKLDMTRMQALLFIRYTSNLQTRYD